MHLLIRPAKTFLFDILENKLSRITGDVGVDAASANFKNRDLFKTKLYYGIDLDQSALENGVRNSDKNAFGILANLANLDMLPDSSADVVVSTNTLYHLPFDARQKAILHLCRITAPHNGSFICELPLNHEFEGLLNKIKQNFKSVKIVYFKNPLSHAYEWIFQRDGFLGSHPIAGLKPFRLLSWLISRFEYLTCYSPFLNKHALIIAKEKNTNEPKKPFEISGAQIISDRLYNTLPIQKILKDKLKKKILIIITKGEVGGAQVSVLNLGRELSKSGYDVVVGFGEGNFLKEKLSKNGIPFVNFRYLRRTFNPITNFLFIVELKKFLDRNKFDVVHFNSSNALLGAIGTKLSYPTPKTIFTFRGLSVLDDNFTKSKIKNWVYIKIFKILLKFINKQIYVSRQNQENATRLGIAKNDTTIYNGLDPKNLEFFTKDQAKSIFGKMINIDLDNKIIIGSIGRLAYQKNYEFLIESANKLKNKLPNLIWLIIGDGPNREKLMDKIKNNGLDKNVFLLGEIKDGFKYLKGFDIFALTSRYEGLSISLIEALFAGSAIIASNVGGNKEMLEDGCGILYKLNDQEKFSDCLEKIIVNSEQRENLSALALIKSKEFDVSSTAKGYKKIIEE